MSEYKKIGEIGVDAGLCWIGDPCYVVAADSSHHFPSWDEFCKRLFASEDETHCTQFNYDLGHAGLGVCVSSGYGDGVYPVYAKFENGRVKEVRVVFFGDEEDDDA